MREEGNAQRRSCHDAGREVGENFDELATLIQSAIDRLADVANSAAMKERLERAKAAADRGASLASKLPSQ
jgi:hypothetical protein